MTREKTLKELEELAEKIGITIRYENMGTLSGGLCRIQDGEVILINKFLSPASKIELLAKELSLEADKLEAVFVLPELRELLGLS
ncbi:MAG TPA: hypothetical protein ENN07_02395 [candidate division Zixibacteria bacterium]|nr:hypothetical protein [candidate division Zixibacteria bacterium]